MQKLILILKNIIKILHLMIQNGLQEMSYILMLNVEIVINIKMIVELKSLYKIILNHSIIELLLDNHSMICIPRILAFLDSCSTQSSKLILLMIIFNTLLIYQLIEIFPVQN
jgi:hypothetical protein